MFRCPLHGSIDVSKLAAFRCRELVIRLFRALVSHTSISQVLDVRLHRDRDLTIGVFLALSLVSSSQIQRGDRALSSAPGTSHRQFPTCHQHADKSIPQNFSRRVQSEQSEALPFCRNPTYASTLRSFLPPLRGASVELSFQN